jgi:phosphoserine phosphatase RsbU/P
MEQAGNLPVLIYADADGPHTLALDRESTSIGRLPGQDLVLRESYISRRHAAIHRVNSSFELIDQRSTHGTYVNGVKVDRAILRSGDLIQFGSLGALKVRFQSAFPAAGSSLAGELLSAISLRSQDEPTVAREMEQLNFLLSAARKLNAGGTQSDIFQALLQLSIQLTAVERGFVFLSQGGQMRLALGLRADGALIGEDSTISRRAIDRAVQSASRFYVGDTRTELDVAEWDSVKDNAIRCIYCVPLRVHVSAAEPPRLLGLLYLDSQIAPGRLNTIDHGLLAILATEAATLLDNARLAEAEFEARKAAEDIALAAAIHAGLRSFTLPTLSYAHLDARTIPCREIGGDFYDAIALPDGLSVVVAGVSGKGVPASIVAATLQGIIHTQMLTGQDLPVIAALVNHFLCSRSVGKYAAMVLLRLYPDGRIDYLNCGQAHPLVVSPSGIVRLDPVNPIVGLFPDAAYAQAQHQLAPGDRILLITDGLAEAENTAEEQFGAARLEDAARLDRLDQIFEHMEDFQSGHPAQNDCTLLEIHYLGSTAPESPLDPA